MSCLTAAALRLRVTNTTIQTSCDLRHEARACSGSHTTTRPRIRIRRARTDLPKPPNADARPGTPEHTLPITAFH